jgi:organic hydroperoxide reductase OsmC/OhrA
MHPYPHTYLVTARGSATGLVDVEAAGLPVIQTSPPPQFDGPEGVWSPETLLCAAIADCLILTFRGISRAARLDWEKLECRVEGTLERADGVSQFTRYLVFADLTVPEGTDVTKARSLLERAEHSCLVSNSLKGERVLEARVTLTPGAAAEPTVCMDCGVPRTA